MKRGGVFVAVFIALGLAAIPSTFVIAEDPPINVHGYLTKYGDKKRPVKDSEVMVVCGSYVKRVRTNENGFYTAQMPRDKCPIGGKIHINCFDLQDGNYIGWRDSIIKEDNNLDVSLHLITDAPEFSVTGGIITGGLAIGAIVFMRRRTNLNKFQF